MRSYNSINSVVLYQSLLYLRIFLQQHPTFAEMNTVQGKMFRKRKSPFENESERKLQKQVNTSYFSSKFIQFTFLVNTILMERYLLY